MKEVKAKVNSTVVLECETWAVPEPTIRWYKDNQVRPRCHQGGAAGFGDCPSWMEWGDTLYTAG